VKELYTKPVVELEEFESLDVITTSAFVDELEGESD
jgi:hypothetical protein